MKAERSVQAVANGLKSFLQRIIISFDLFNKNELLNHAGASAFFFLLSVAPVLFLLVMIFERLVQVYPGFSEGFFHLLARFNPGITRDTLAGVGLLSRRSVAVDIIGVLTMLWFSRLILLGIQRGLGIIFPADKPRTPITQNLIALALLPPLILFIVVIVFISIGLDVSNTLALNRLSTSSFLNGLLGFLGGLLPYAVLFLLIFSAYKLIPVERPKTAAALLGALLCTAGVAVVQVLIAKVFNVARFNLIYGVLGSLILTLIGIYIVFQLFFIFAQFTYVTDRFDVLAVERMLRFRGRKAGKGGKLGRYLFNRPERLMRKLAREHPAGDVLFREGDGDRDIFFVYEGTIGIHLETGGEEPRRIAVVRAGEIFGEMAYLLDEPRTATAITESPCVLVILTPKLFEGLLKVNYAVSRNVIELLCDRLRETHRSAAV